MANAVLRNPGTTDPWLIRFGAVCAALLGLSLGVPGVIEGFTGETAATSFVVGFGAAFGPPALQAFYLHTRARSRFDSLAYAVNLIGLCLFSAVSFTLNLVVFFQGEEAAENLPGPTRAALLIVLAVFVTGTVLFGFSMLRSGAFPALPVWGYLLGIPLLAILAPLPDTPITSLFHVAACATLLWLAAALYRPALPSHRPPY